MMLGKSSLQVFTFFLLFLRDPIQSSRIRRLVLERDGAPSSEPTCGVKLLHSDASFPAWRVWHIRQRWRSTDCRVVLVLLINALFSHLNPLILH